MRRAMLLLWSLVIAMPANCDADELLTRPQALRELGKPDAAARRAAAARLGEIGLNADVPALVRALRDRDDATREIAEQAIWAVWSRSGDRATDELFQEGLGQMNAGLAQDAIATFSRIIRRQPAFAEGWNKRATVYYSVGEYTKSLRDCEEVIKRNPLHFGALSGYGLIYIQLDQPELALGYFERALRINPNMLGVLQNIDMLRKLIDEKRRRYV